MSGFKDEEGTTGLESTSTRFPSLQKPGKVEDLDSLMLHDRGMYKAVEEVVTGLRNDMVPNDVQQMIVESMSPSVQRELVAKIAGLEASVLMTFKNQIQLVDAVLKRVVNPDGSKSLAGEGMDISVKEAINMSLKVTQVLVRDLPKIYTIDRIQRQERALLMLIERHFDKEAQENYLQILANYEEELDRESKRA